MTRGRLTHLFAAWVGVLGLAACGDTVRSTPGTGGAVDATAHPSADAGARHDAAVADGRDANQASPLDGRTDASSTAPPPRDAAVTTDGFSCAAAASFFDGGCGDLGTDPHNCGGCGRDCEGGACSDGGCAPIPAGALATGQLDPIAMAADGVNVYWLTVGATWTGHGDLPPMKSWGAQVLRCAATGCGNRPTVLVTYPPLDGVGAVGGLPVAPSALAVDATNVYWTDAHSVRACAIGGCGCSPTSLASGLIQPPGVAAAAGRVFWTVWTSGSPDTGDVGSCPVAGCAGASPTLLATAQGGAQGVAADDSDVYWLDTSAGAGSVLRCPVGGCDGGPTELASDQGNPIAVALDATNVYWTSPVGSVVQCSKADCPGTIVTLASGRGADDRNGPSGIAVDSSYVYWRESNIYRCAIGGCGNAPTLVATASSSPYQWDATLAVDATRVYWTQHNATNDDWIMSAPK